MVSKFVEQQLGREESSGGMTHRHVAQWPSLVVASSVSLGL